MVRQHRERPYQQWHLDGLNNRDKVVLIGRSLSDLDALSRVLTPILQPLEPWLHASLGRLAELARRVLQYQINAPLQLGRGLGVTGFIGTLVEYPQPSQQGAPPPLI